jgi:DNA-binding NtrC family response regulator
VIKQNAAEFPRSDGGASYDRELIYRSLIDMRNEISELKQMLGKFMYSQYSGGGSSRLLLTESATTAPTMIDPSTIHARVEDTTPSAEIDHHLDSESLLLGEEIPSLEEAERYLIEKALLKFDGNRRKAAQMLGVSERTLYRKIDQYNLG